MARHKQITTRGFWRHVLKTPHSLELAEVVVIHFPAYPLLPLELSPYRYVRGEFPWIFTLPDRAGLVRRDRFNQPVVSVGGDQADAAEAAGNQVGEEAVPRRAGLGRSDP